MSVNYLKQIEEEFSASWQRITNILSSMLDTEVALVNSVYGDELEVIMKNKSTGEYFKLNYPYDLEDVYCEKVVKNSEMLEINNALDDDRFAKYEGAKMGLISYLGYPILSPDDRVVGTICVEDTRAREFSIREKELMLQFKELVENQIKQLNLTKRLEAQMDRCYNLHQQFLPKNLPALDNISYGTHYQPAERLGGDFYEAKKISDKLLFYLSDVSGHDLSSAMLNIFLKESFYSYIMHNQGKNDFLQPAKILKYLNQRFTRENFPVDYYISIIIGVYDLKKEKITLSNGGMNVFPFIVEKYGQIDIINCKGFPITALSEPIDYEEYSRYFKKGDILHLFTDGWTEQKNSSGELFGYEKLLELNSSSNNELPAARLQKIYQEFIDFKKDVPLQDDLTALLIKRGLA